MTYLLNNFGRTNLIVIVHIITGLGDGGAQSVLFRLCAEDKVHQHVVVSLSDSGKYGPLLEDYGIETFTLDMPKRSFLLCSALQLYRILRTLNPDVIQTWMYHADFFGGLVARWAGFSSIVWGIRHSTLEQGKSSGLTILIAKLSAIASGWLPAKIAVCAQRAMEVHDELGYCKAKMQVIPNGFDLERFKPQKSLDLAAIGVSPIVVDNPVIATIGRYDPQKDHATLLKALAILRARHLHVTCLLVGTGLDSNNHELTELIVKNDLMDSVVLLGARNDIPAVLNAADVHVLSSAFGEGFPNVVAEAMSCGTPCVVTDVGDAANIVGETGWVVPSSNPLALANALQLALEDLGGSEMEWQQRCKDARARIRDNFSIQNMISSYHSIWEEALRDSRIEEIESGGDYGK